METVSDRLRVSPLKFHMKPASDRSPPVFQRALQSAEAQTANGAAHAHLNKQRTQGVCLSIDC